jgi:uroporphyrinogen decarboxylase
MSMTPRERLLAACRNQPVDRPPVWLMRQAGRYLPEYLAVREKHSFWDVVRTPELAVEVTLQPLRRYQLDASIIFSDILTIPEAAGSGVVYGNGGPTMTHAFAGEDDVRRLIDVDIAHELSYVGDAVRLMCEHIHPRLALYGFAGAPLTLAAYMVEGGPSRDLRHLKGLAYHDPDLVRRLLFALADKVADLLRLQVEAGADVVQVFDSWAGLLCPDDYKSLALPAVRRVFARIADLEVPKVLYLRGAASHLKEAATAGADLLSIDQTIRLDQARALLGPEVPLQGNMDAAELLGPHDRIRWQVQDMHAQTGGQGWIVNLGQGLVPDIPPEAVQVFVDAVVELG